MINLERQNNLVIIKMNHPPANAIDGAFCSKLNEIIKNEIESDSKAIILTGEGSIFSAGVDLVQLLKGGSDYVREFLVILERTFETLFFCPKPVVAAINGHAIAGGCVIANCADHRLMIEGKAKIGVPELRVGVPFPVIVMEIMRAKVQPACFEEIILGGATYNPDDAKQRGLIDEIVQSEDLMDKALETAELLAAIRPEIYSFTKFQIRQVVREAIDSRNNLHANEINTIWQSEQTQQAIRTYMEKTFKK